MGVAGRLAVGPRQPSRRTTRRGARASFNAVYGQVPGELAPKLALALRVRAVRRARRRRVPLHGVRAHRRQLHGPGRVRAGADPHRTRRRRRCARGARPGPLDEPRLRGGEAAAGAAAGGVRAWPARPVGRVGQYRVRDHRPARPRAAAHRRAAVGARRSCQDQGPQDSVAIAGVPAAEPAAAGRARAAPTATWPRSRPRATSGSRWWTGRTRCAGGPCGDRATDVATTTCPSCGAVVAEGERFCESCGADLPGAGPAMPRFPPGCRPRAVATRGADEACCRARAEVAVREGWSRPVDLAVRRRRARRAAGRSRPTGTASSAGRRRRIRATTGSSEPAPWVVGVCDRGVRHSRNEDAVACRGRTPAPSPCSWSATGSSTAPDSDLASLAAARAARDVLAGPPSAGAVEDARRLDAAQARGRRARRRRGGRRAAVAGSGRGNPPSTTFVAAVVDGADASSAGSATAGPTGCPTRAAAGAALDRRLVGGRADRAGRAARGGGDRADRRTRSPAGSAPTPRTSTPRTGRPAARRGRAGCWSAATACGTTVRRPPTLGELVARHGRERLAPTPPASSRQALVHWANEQGGARQHHRRARPLGDVQTRPPHAAPEEHIRWPQFTAEVFQNEFLPDGGHRRPRDRDDHVLRRRRGGAAARAATRPRSSSSTPRARCSGDRHRRRAAGGAGGDRPDRRRHVVRGDRRHRQRRRCAFPYPNAGRRWSGWSPARAPRRSGPCGSCSPAAARRWARGCGSPTRLFASVPQATQRHAILLTDGKNQSESRGRAAGRRSARSRACSSATAAASARTGTSTSCAASPPPCWARSTSSPPLHSSPPSSSSIMRNAMGARRRRRHAAGVGAAGRAGAVRPPGRPDGRGPHGRRAAGQPADRRLPDGGVGRREPRLPRGRAARRQAGRGRAARGAGAARCRRAGGGAGPGEGDVVRRRRAHHPDQPRRSPTTPARPSSPRRSRRGWRPRRPATRRRPRRSSAAPSSSPPRRATTRPPRGCARSSRSRTRTPVRFGCSRNVDKLDEMALDTSSTKTTRVKR